MNHKQILRLALVYILHLVLVCLYGCPCKPLPNLTWHWWTVTSLLICSCTCSHWICRLMTCILFKDCAMSCICKPLHLLTLVHTFKSYIFISNKKEESKAWMRKTSCLPSAFLLVQKNFACLRDSGMSLLLQCHLAQTSPEELGVFRNVHLITRSSLTRATL